MALSSSCGMSDGTLPSPSTDPSGWSTRAAVATDEITVTPVLTLEAPAFPWPSCFLPKFRRLVCVDRCPDGGVGTTLAVTPLLLLLLLFPRDVVGAEDEDTAEGVTLILILLTGRIGEIALLFGPDDDDDDAAVPACDVGGTGRSSGDAPAATSRVCDWSCFC